MPSLRRTPIRARRLGVAVLSCVALAASATASHAQTAAISIAGSTTLEPLVRAAADAYRAQHPDVGIIVSGGGSQPAMRSVKGGTLDVADSDVDPGDDSTLSDHRVAAIAFAVVANPGTGVTSVTHAQAADLLSGRATNWKQLGGNDVPVFLVGRPKTSGLVELVRRRILSGESPAAGSDVEAATDAALARVASAPGGATVATLGAAQETKLTLLAIDGVAPGVAGVASGTYPLWAFEHMITAGAPSVAVSRFLAFLETDRELLHRFGYIAPSELGPAALTP